MSGAIARLGALVAAIAALGALAAPARGAPSDPLFVFTPTPSPVPPKIPPPTGYLEGPCGLAVDSSGNFYVSDYYHHAVDVFSPAHAYQTQLANEDPLDGPCALALDSADHLYLDNYHRNLVKFNPSPAFGAGAVIAGAPLDSSRPTGVAVDPATDRVYVNERTQIAVYDSSGAAVMDGPNPLIIGLGSLEDGYGLAVSSYPATAGRLYVPDAASETVEVYDPTVSKVNPVATIDGHATPNAGFVSLRDSAVAVDRASGNLYVADDLQPQYTERPQAAVYVFGPTGTYLGHLKYNVVDALPPGLAVDNSAGPTQGRVYLTSGNTVEASVYAYPPGAQTTAPGICVPFAVCPAGSAATGGLGGTGQASAAARQQAAPPGPAAPEEAAASELTQRGNLRVSASGKLSPHTLPRHGAAPIAVSVSWKVSTTDASPVPKLRKLALEINRHGHFDYAGLPTCPYKRIQPASSARALAACRSALVGKGAFTANVALGGQEAYDTRGRLLLFNGKSHGRSVLFAQIYAPHPFATSFVIVFEIEKLPRGAYGTALSATLPRSLAAWGNLTGIEMRLARRYSYRGHLHSFLSAGCPAPEGFSRALFPLARGSFDFAGAEQLRSVLSGACRARG